MDIKEFVEETLFGIVSGGHATKDKFAQSGMDVDVFHAENDSWGLQKIEFDIALTVSETTTSETGAGIKIAVARIGGDLSSSQAQSNISRVKFEIPLYLKNKNYKKPKSISAPTHGEF